jgi:hypothetical protein
MTKNALQVKREKLLNQLNQGKYKLESEELVFKIPANSKLIKSISNVLKDLVIKSGLLRDKNE